MTQFSTATLIPMRINKVLRIPGYVLHLDNLSRICNLLDRISHETAALSTKTIYSVTFEKSKTVRYSDIHALNSGLDAASENIDSVSIQYDGAISVSLAFEAKGKIEVNVVGANADVQYYTEQILREAERCDQEHNWAVKTFIFKRWPTSLLFSLIMGLSLSLSFTIGMFFLVQSIGVNVDPSIIPAGNSYAQRVEESLKTQDVNKKLDTLLISQLRGFTNARDFISQQQQNMVYFLVGIAICVIILLVLRKVKELYPLSYIAMGRQKEKMSKMERQREVWGIGIIVAFIINIVSGIILSFFG